MASFFDFIYQNIFFIIIGLAVLAVSAYIFFEIFAKHKRIAHGYSRIRIFEGVGVMLLVGTLMFTPAIDFTLNYSKHSSSPGYYTVMESQNLCVNSIEPDIGLVFGKEFPEGCSGVYGTVIGLYVLFAVAIFSIAAGLFKLK